MYFVASCLFRVAGSTPIDSIWDYRVRLDTICMTASLSRFRDNNRDFMEFPESTFRAVDIKLLFCLHNSVSKLVEHVSYSNDFRYLPAYYSFLAWKQIDIFVVCLVAFSLFYRKGTYLMSGLHDVSHILVTTVSLQKYFNLLSKWNCVVLRPAVAIWSIALQCKWSAIVIISAWFAWDQSRFCQLLLCWWLLYVPSFMFTSSKCTFANQLIPSVPVCNK